MDLEQSSDKAYGESPLMKLMRDQFPDIPDAVLHAAFVHGYAMGSLHAFVEAHGIVDDVYAEQQIRRDREEPRWLRELRQGAKEQ